MTQSFVIWQFYNEAAYVFILGVRRCCTTRDNPLWRQSIFGQITSLLSLLRSLVSIYQTVIIGSDDKIIKKPRGSLWTLMVA